MEKKFSHFITRVRERYGLHLTVEDLYNIAKEIRSGRAKLSRANARSFQYKVRYKKKLLIMILDRQHSAFITALPETKYNTKVTFSKKQYNYVDALYINHQFIKCFSLSRDQKPVCPKCGCTGIISELGKDRFKCESCGHIVNYKTIEKPNYLVLTQDASGFSTTLNLNYDLWWYLYLTNETIELSNDFVIKPVLSEDFSYDQLFEVSYKYRKTNVLCSKYTVKELEEKLYDN